MAEVRLRKYQHEAIGRLRALMRGKRVRVLRLPISAGKRGGRG